MYREETTTKGSKKKEICKTDFLKYKWHFFIKLFKKCSIFFKKKAFLSCSILLFRKNNEILVALNIFQN